MTRREFLRAGAGAGVVSMTGTPAWPSQSADEIYRNALVIDTLATAGVDLNPAAAIAAGQTAAVTDLAIYPRSYEQAKASLAEWAAVFAKPNSQVMKVLTAADLEAAKRTKRFGIILSAQDASVLGVPTFSVNDANLTRLAELHASGLRVLQLAHNERNGVADGYRERIDAGLSLLGEAVVSKMNELRMLIDLSHCSDLTTTQAIARSKQPCAITHAGCRALYDTRRNKTDAQIRQLADRGGVFGVFAMSLWLSAAPTAGIDVVVDHIAHAVNVGGEEHVSFGSDGPIEQDDTPVADQLAGMRRFYERNRGLPGSEREPMHVTVEELKSPDRLERLARALAKRGIRTAAIDKILGRNFARLFGAVCGTGAA